MKNGNVYYVFPTSIWLFCLHLVQIVFRQLINYDPCKQRNSLQRSLITLILFPECYNVMSQHFHITSVTTLRDINIIHNHQTLRESSQILCISVQGELEIESTLEHMGQLPLSWGKKLMPTK